jgi:hypothetical protein
VQLGAGVNVVVRGPKLVNVHQPSETEMGVFIVVVDGDEVYIISLIGSGVVLYIRVLAIQKRERLIYCIRDSW